MKEEMVNRHFDLLKFKIDEVYSFSSLARSSGNDFVDDVEVPIALSMAEKVVNLISTIYPQIKNDKLVNRILELEEQFGKLDSTIVFKIAEEISDEVFCTFENKLEAMDAAIRVGFAYSTLGVVSSPIEGYTGLMIGKRLDGKEYIVANFSGPIRSAGTTASCLVLILIDFMRERFGFDKYDPTEEEKKRMFIELQDFDSKVSNLQYMPTEEEMNFISENLSIQISGDPSEQKEVSNFKKLSRLNTDFLRSGVCLVLGEGLSQKAAKGLRLLNRAKKNGIKYSGFEWLENYVKIHEKRILGNDNNKPTYMKDIVAGRPVFSYPSRSGGFRFRYGRSRNSGFSAVALNPATMKVLDNFVGIGTQLKIEKPSKGCVVSSCDFIDGPIIKLKSGSVKKINNIKDLDKTNEEIDEIIYVGDILFPYSDVLNRNSELISPGYVEEWWFLELKEKGFEDDIDFYNVNFSDALILSKKYDIPLHPKYIFYWTQISNKEFFNLINWLKESRFCSKLILPWSNIEKENFIFAKRALEILGVSHEVYADHIVVDEMDSMSLIVNLGLPEELLNLDIYLKDFFSEDFFSEGSVFEIINKNSNYKIKDKAGEFIGARMGRPEKAKLRKISGSPNSLFVLGKEGGRLKTFQSALDSGKTTSFYPLFFCEECNSETIFPRCEKCKKRTVRKFYFKDLEGVFEKDKNNNSKYFGVPYSYRSLDIKYYFKNAMKNLGFSDEDSIVVKGVSENKSFENILEPIEKGILRAKYGLFVNKDGTIRFDGTELPLTHFKPSEIGTSYKKLRELGYEKDVFGNELKNDEQILELMPHDVLIPSSDENPEEKGDDVFIKICNFVDELLIKFYGLDSYYNVRKREDLIGHIGVCMAPHNCAGVACRFIGFSNTLGIMASPFMHAAIRRDCDGDEMALMLLGDVLLNFSRKYLPNRRGSTQDTPLVLNAKIDAGEVDDQILDLECVNEYPIDLYRFAEEKKHSSLVKVRTVRDVLLENKNPFVSLGYTHEVIDFNSGVHCSSYKLIEDMISKVNLEMDLAKKIRAVDEDDLARLIIEKHFLKDIIGNFKKFFIQNFRCVECNSIMRRPPLSGVCDSCGGKIMFTVSKGSVKKYLGPAIDLANKYNVGDYLRNVLDLLKKNIDSVFGVSE